MIIDSHMHLIDTGCFDKPTYDALGQSIPADTDIDQLVSWMRALRMHGTGYAKDMAFRIRRDRGGAGI